MLTIIVQCCVLRMITTNDAAMVLKLTALTVVLLFTVDRGAEAHPPTLTGRARELTRHIGGTAGKGDCNVYTLLRASCLMLEIKEFRCYEVESEKAGSPWESNPGHLWPDLPVLCH